MADALSAKDRMLLECIRGEFNNQPLDERLRTGDFMDFDAATELLREREHAMANVWRIDARIATILDSVRKRRTASVKPGDCIHCGKECCNDFGWCNSFKAAPAATPTQPTKEGESR